MKKELNKLKKTVQEYQQKLINQFSNNTENIRTISKQYSHFVDSILFTLWEKCLLENNTSVCLVAQGSYGRSNLLLHSDLDILILLSDKTDKQILNAIELFIQQLWDIGFTVGQHITTADDCIELASQDITVISNLLDARLLKGNPSLLDKLNYSIHPSQMWSSAAFLKAKCQEQSARYKKFNESAYHLEPNVKQGPGGLRDIEMIHLIIQRHFGGSSLEACLTYDLLTEQEYLSLLECQAFLWRVRFAIHTIARRPEDRLLFDYQKKIATILHYKDSKKNLAIEKFMQNYFTVIKTLRTLSEIVIQLFKESLFYPHTMQITPVDKHFQIHNDHIEVRNIQTFKQHPSALFLIFKKLIEKPVIKGIRANTLRLLHSNKHLIDKNYRHSKTNTRLFLYLLTRSNNVFEYLQQMNRYGLLGQYIPEFGDIVGQMQYDLFHIYTVDQHSLFVIRNLEKFQNENSAFPLCHTLFEIVEKKELLYLAALFHDIGKGKNGCHSTIGAKIAFQFCKRHRLDQKDTNFVCILVQHHLLLSITAQRKDLHDPQTIIDFCQVISNKPLLVSLYLLTVADICATNPNLWNGWKDALLKTLYQKASEYLHKQTYLEAAVVIKQKQQKALELITGIDKKFVQMLWRNIDDDHFLQEPPAILATQTECILKENISPTIIVLPRADLNATQVLIYNPHLKKRFQIATTVLSNLNLSVVEARITTGKNGYDLDSYNVLDAKNNVITSNRMIERIKQMLRNYLTPPVTLPSLSVRHMSRKQRHFFIQPSVSFIQNKRKKRTLVLVIATDRKSILARISHVFNAFSFHLHKAKIVTAGEKIEDTFFISNKENKRLTKQEEQSLKTSLISALSFNNDLH